MHGLSVNKPQTSSALPASPTTPPPAIPAVPGTRCYEENLTSATEKQISIVLKRKGPLILNQQSFFTISSTR
jgi:hypothetical protein